MSIIDLQFSLSFYASHKRLYTIEQTQTKLFRHPICQNKH